MPLRFFHVRCLDPLLTETELNSFLSNHRVINIDRRLIDSGIDSFWSICVDFISTVQPNSPEAKQKKGRIDYREVLTPEEFNRFVGLRDLRSRIGIKDGVPVYTIFTNEQLAQMIQTNVQTVQELSRIEGIGDARLAKYGKPFIDLLNGISDAAPR